MSSDFEDYEILSSTELDEDGLISDTSASNQSINKIRQWLQATDYDGNASEYKRHLNAKAPGTGLWIHDTQKYKQWHDSPKNGAMWIKGVPGVGKSVIAASAIHHFTTVENATVLYFFFRHIVEANKGPKALVRDWLDQLLPYSPAVRKLLTDTVQAHRPLNAFSLSQLWMILATGLRSLAKAYCVIDGLDEMDEIERQEFLSKLNHLGSFRPDSVKVLITSRPKQYLQSALNLDVIHVSFERELVGHDIAAYVRHRVSLLSLNENDTEDMVDSVCTRCDGLFLYARLCLDQIQSRIFEDAELTRDVSDLIKATPVGLEEMYNCILRNQD